MTKKLTEGFIAQSNHYVVKVGLSSEGERCYQVYNKRHTVKEAETFILSQALTYIQTLEESLKALTSQEIDGVIVYYTYYPKQ